MANNIPDEIYQKPVHEALLNLIDGAAKVSADRIINLLEIIPHLQIESGYTEICDSLWRLNEATNCVFARLIEPAVNCITVMKLKSEIDSHNLINLDDEPVEKARGIFLPNKNAITFAMIGENHLSELRMLSIKMQTLLMNPEPAGDSWKVMIETGISEVETLFQKIRSAESPT